MSDNLDILVQNLRGERDEYPGEYVKEAAEAIDRLRAELAKARNASHAAGVDGLIDEESFRAQLAEKDKRIEELAGEVRALTGTVEGYEFISHHKINAAWEHWGIDSPSSSNDALEALGIVACEECGGVGVGVSEHCTNCSGNGWVMEGR